MKAYTGKNNIIDTIGDHVGGNSRPTLFVSSSKRRQHLPTPPRHKLRGSIGSSCFGCARNDPRSRERSRLSVPLSQYEPNDSTRVGEGRSGVRGRVLSQSLLVARERRRRELGSNLVIVTTTFTSGEGHVVEDGISRRVRKILAGVPASVSFRDLILALSLSRAKRQYWTVGNRPIRHYDLRSLRRYSAEAQIQDRSRQKTGLNTVPGFSRVYNKPPLRGAKGTRAQHAGDARNPPPPSFPRAHPSFPRTTPSFPRTREPREKQSTPFSSPSRSEGDACAARRGCTKFTTPVIPASPSVIPASPSVIPADYPVIPADAGTQRKTKHAFFLPFAERRGRVRSTQGMHENHHPRPSPGHAQRRAIKGALYSIERLHIHGLAPIRSATHSVNRSQIPSPSPIV